MYKSIGRWVKPASGSDPERERKYVYDTLTARGWWVALKRDARIKMEQAIFPLRDFLLFFQSLNERLP
jgi:hypothetical protein